LNDELTQKSSALASNSCRSFGESTRC